MPRVIRRKSISHNYHTILRGINKQDIFIDKEDRIKFIQEMKRAKDKYSYLLYSFALMPNHIHIELKDNEDKLSQIMHFLAANYASYFNKKYERVGAVFQGRYLSKPVENERYLLNLMRYIHQNPQKAGIARVNAYYWSSYREYISEVENGNKLVDTECLLKLLGKDKEEAIRNFKKFNNELLNFQTGEEILEYEMSTRITDEELIYIIQNHWKIYNIQEIQNYGKKRRDELLYEISKIKGTQLLQISRVLGINKKIIQRAIEQSKNMVKRPVPKVDKNVHLGVGPQKNEEDVDGEG